MPDDPVIAIEIDFFDRAHNAARMLPLCNVGGLVATIGGERRIYEPVLITPFSIGHNVNVGFGESAQASSNRGQIEFAVSDRVAPYLSYSVMGRACRIYSADRAEYGALVQVFQGVVDGLSYDPLAIRASIEVTDARISLDAPLIDELYAEADDVDPSLLGQPKPQIWGSVLSIEPVLEDDAGSRYRISRAEVTEVSDLRAGGVPWTRVVGTPGSPGEWRQDPIDSGRVQLGGPALGDELRIDARGGTYTTAALVTEIVEAAGAHVDAAAMAALDIAAPFEIGYQASRAINRQTALDEIMGAIAGWWSSTSDGSRIAAGVWAAPVGPVATTFTAHEIASLRLMERLPPVWRVKVERNRNWQPASRFREAVTDAEQAAMKATGITCPAFLDDADLRTIEPRAVDLPLLRTLVHVEADAYSIRDRAWDAWSVPRTIWRMEIRGDCPPLMATVGVYHEQINNLFRVVSARQSFGGGLSELLLWG